MTGEWPTSDLDHLNRIRSDNRIANLRLATESQNAYNRSLSIVNTSGAKGVSWNKVIGKWVVYFSVNRSKRYFGSFCDFEEAKKIYAEAAEKYAKEFAYPAVAA